jgi:hypothetical protein
MVLNCNFNVEQDRWASELFRSLRTWVRQEKSQHFIREP